MGDIIKVTEEEKRAFVKKAKVGMLKAAKVMGPSYIAVQEYCNKHNISREDAPFTSYVVDDWEKTTKMGFFKMIISLFTQKWDMEMGFVVDSEHSLTNSGDIEAIALPAGDYLQTIHQGPYMNVGETYKQIYAYAQEQGLTLGGKSYEFYLNDPREVQPTELETKVMVPLG